MSVELSPNGLLIDGQFVPVYSGTVHYWRLERALWPKILDQVRELGFSMIETYIPWAIHEINPGHYDWGQEDERKDVEAFMQLCEERGLWLLVRPGPLINAELTNFGFPEWVLQNPDVQARTALDTPHFDAAWGLHPPLPFPVPSYASPVFYEAVAGWFDAVCPIVVRHLASKGGCVVAVQSDNETCYLFHDQPYATDYSAASLQLYRKFLAERYAHDIANLNTIYQTDYTDFQLVKPPRDCEVSKRTYVAWHLDWIAYKEYQIRWCVTKIARMLRERGIAEVPVFHDIAYQHRTPLDVSRLEAEPDIDWVGINLYRNQESYRSAVQQVRFMAGSTRLPFVPELGCGIWSHHPRTPLPKEEEFITLSTLMHGLKAFNLYMLVERERWQGCPITRHGELRLEYADFYYRLNNFLKRYEMWQMERKPTTLVMLNYDMERYAAMASTLNYGHVDLLDLPSALFEVDLDMLELKGDVAKEADDHRRDNWLGTVISWLDSHFVDYNLADTHLSLAQLQQYKLICLPTVDFMDEADQQTLLEFIKNGGHLVIGPIVPYLNPILQPAQVLAEYIKVLNSTVSIGNGKLTWLEQAKIAETLETLTPLPNFYCDQPKIDLTVHHSEAFTLLFVANPTAATVTTCLSFEGRATLKAAWEGEQVLCGTNEISLTLPAYSVQIWEVNTDA